VTLDHSDGRDQARRPGAKPSWTTAPLSGPRPRTATAGRPA